MSKITIQILIILLFLNLIPVAEAITWNDFPENIPSRNGSTIYDRNNFTYSSSADGVYHIDYGNGNSTYFGFALSGTVGSTDFVKFTSDYSWGISLAETTRTIDISAKNNDSNWITNFSFTPEHTKITNTLTNTLPIAITNAKFYYVFTIGEGDTVQYNGTNYTIPASPNVHTSGNLTANIPTMKLNGNMIFDFQDIIDNGFTITDFYIRPGTSLGLTYAGNVAAIGFTKNGGVFPAGSTVVIDPTLSNAGFESGSGSWQTGGTGTYTVVSPGYEGENMAKYSLVASPGQLFQYNFTLDPNTWYRFSVVANSTNGGNVYFYVTRHSSPYTNYGLSYIPDATPTLQRFTKDFLTSGFSTSTTDVRLQFFIAGTVTETYYFDSVVLEKIAMPPAPTTLENTQGNFWVNYTWSEGSGNSTNSYNVSANDTWFNGTTDTFYNSTGMAAHGWSNISVYSYNSTGLGELNTTPVSQNTQITNNPISIGNISAAYTANIGGTVSIYPTYSDADADVPIFGNTTTNGTFYSNNGTFIWSPGAGAEGTYNWQINVSDANGSTDYINFSLSVNSTTPGAVVGLTSTQSNFWINNTWSAPVNANSYNISVNDTWFNGTTDTFYNSTGMSPHNWSNITILAFNNTAGSVGASASQNTQISNNLPTFSDASISSSSFTTAGSTLVFVTVTDIDGDNLSVDTGVTATSLGGSQVNYTMTQSGNNYTYLFSTATPATYTVTGFYANDTYNVTGEATALSFTVSAVSVVSGGGGGGGGGGYTQINTTIVQQVLNSTPLLLVSNLSTGSIPASQAISDCLTESLFLQNACSQFNYGLIIEPTNYWVWLGAFLGAFLIIILTKMYVGNRDIVTETALYGLITIMIAALLVSFGVNMFVMNYIMASEKYAWTFLSMAIFGAIAAAIGDRILYKTHKLKTFKLNLERPFRSQ